jgi:lysophospholipase L1-like esterase
VIVSGCAAPVPRPPIDPGPTAKPAQPGCVAAGEPDSLCILVLGDSIAEGIPVDGERRWYRQLRAQLQAALPDRTVAIDNWAIAGSQVWVLASAARDQPAIETYDLAIVIEGVNDEHVMPVETWLPRYEQAIEMLEAKGLTVILGTPPPSYENGAFMTRYDPVAAAVRDVASRGRPLLDIAARWLADGPAVAGRYYADLIHQSGEGQDLMAVLARDVVLDTVRAMDDMAGPASPRP